MKILIFDVKGDTLYLHDDSVPVHSYFTITIENDNTFHCKKEKMFIADVDRLGQCHYH
jgi:hypothetical protein